MYAGHKPSAIESQRTTYFTFITYDDFLPETLDLRGRETVTLVSIDPAQKNLAVRIERRRLHPQKVGEVETLVFTKRSVVPEGFAKKKGEKSQSQDLDQVFQATTAYLNTYFTLLVQADLVLIERQMTFNIRSTRVMQHLISYFSLIFSLYPSPTGRYRYLIEIDSKAKTHKLDAPKDMSKNQVKNWVTTYAQRLLQQRADETSLRLMKQLGSKQDDLADTCAQIEATLRHFGWPTEQVDMSGPTNSLLPAVLCQQNGQLKTKAQISQQI